jgi:hypothetical protein
MAGRTTGRMIQCIRRPLFARFVRLGLDVDRSLSASRNAPSPIITRTAVIPKEITIAVSTSACGSGSV